jgi:hypothetical protein
MILGLRMRANLKRFCVPIRFERFRAASESRSLLVYSNRKSRDYLSAVGCDALEKRRKLMDAWAQFCEANEIDNVVALRPAAAAT